MADQTYRVVVDYSLDTHKAEGQLDRLTEMFNNLKRVAAVAFTIDAISSYISKVVELGSQAENATIRIAGMMQAAGAKGAADFNDSLRMSAALVEMIRERSASLPGTWQDLATIVKRNMIFGLNSGLSPVGVMDMSAQMQALFGGEHASAQISRSLQEMLSGHVRGQNPIFQQLSEVMRSDLKGDTKAFNQLGTKERREAVQEALAKQKDAIDELSRTYDTRLSTLQNHIGLVFLEGTKYSFKFFKDTLKGLDEWVQEHRVELAGYITLFSRAFNAILEDVFRIFKAIGPYVLDVLEGIIKPFVPVLMGIQGIIGLIADALGYVSEKGEGLRPFFVLVGNLLGMFLVWRAAVLAINTAMNIFSVTMRVLAAINPFTGYVIAIVGIIAAVMIALAYIKELQNAFEEMIDTKASRWFLKKAGIIPENATDADINEAMASRTRERGGKSVFGQFDDPAKHMKDLFSDHGALGGLGPAIGNFFGKLNFDGFGKSGILDAILKKLQTAGIVKNGHTNVNVRIEQTVKTDEDPERIRILTRQGLAEALDQALHHPQETPGSHFSVLRY